MIKSYLTTAFRNLFRNKVYSFINIAGLSLGLACAMLIILYTKDELSFDRFNTNSANIYRIVRSTVTAEGSVDGKGASTGAFQGPKFTAGIPEIRAFVRYSSIQKELKQKSEILNREVFVADPGFFSVFSFPLLSGNPLTALKEPNSVVVSEDMAKEQFGTSEALGKIILFKDGDKFEPYTVTGVAKNTPQNSSIRFNILMPLKIDPEDENWGNFFLTTFVLTAPGADLKQVETKMNSIFDADAQEFVKMFAGDEKKSLVFSLQPLQDMHLNKDYKGSAGVSRSSDPMYSYILSGIALFILLIACINFVNLTVARSVKRAKEIGVRKVIGGDRKQLMAQFLGESFILCSIAFILAILIVQTALPSFNYLANKALNFSYLLDAKLISGYLALFFITGFMAGFYPAMVLSNYNPVQTLYNRFTLAGKNYLQKSLVVFQFSLATLLVISATTIYSQFNYLINKDLGYDDENVIAIEKRRIMPHEARVFKSELLKSPNIVNVAVRNFGRQGTAAKINGETEIEFAYERVDESYLPLYKIPLVKGRNFSAAFPSDSAHTVLVNEAFVKEAGWKQPLGQQVSFRNGTENYAVAGVVKDYHSYSLAEKIGPQLFTMKVREDGYGLVLIRIKPNTSAASLQYIEKTFKKLYPASSFVYEFKDLENLKNYEAEAKWKQMMLFGAVITIFISCIGLFGLSVLSAEKRTKEIGIRKVLGASVGRVVTTLSTDFLELVTLAMLIAMPVAWLLADKWLAHYPYRITMNFWMFASAGLLIIVIALATVSFQAIRAAIANPVKSLRSE